MSREQRPKYLTKASEHTIRLRVHTSTRVYESRRQGRLRGQACCCCGLAGDTRFFDPHAPWLRANRNDHCRGLHSRAVRSGQRTKVAWGVRAGAYDEYRRLVRQILNGDGVAGGLLSRWIVLSSRLGRRMWWIVGLRIWLLPFWVYSRLARRMWWIVGLRIWLLRLWVIRPRCRRHPLSVHLLVVSHSRMNGPFLEPGIYRVYYKSRVCWRL
jgi:hypothetical protein